ncbi:hypothetical protein CYY_001033 [Polysphondylium violaceum]|uniref:Huntingtin family protein n=1 Tax=Polysphondylium violaceum TaxID=133409 RepID=A0A8J4Q0Q2_9MYCE|nr:hypothetical protein CYY_001033 [Polysphondylium violaceum]
MDLIKALDVLSTSPIDTEDQYLRKDKIEACRTVSEQICAPSLRNTADFPRFLSIAISLLLRAHGDKDLNVYSVAEESLNRTIKILIYSYHERILFELFKVLKGRPPMQTQQAANELKKTGATTTGTSTPGDITMSGGVLPSVPSTPILGLGQAGVAGSPPTNSPLGGSSISSSGANSIFNTAHQILSKPFPFKSQRIALIKFGEVCSYIRPSKCRKYIISLVPPINNLLQLVEDESLQESISISMENISKILISYLKENEVHQLIDLFMKNLNQPSAAVRRAASLSITSICRYYPKPLFEHTIDALYNFSYPNSPPLSSITSSAHIPTPNSQNNHKILGVLFSYLQLIKLYQELSLIDIKILDTFSLKIQFFSNFILKYIKLPGDNEPYDHNIVGLGLELLQQLLSTFGQYEYSWPKSLVQEIILQLRTLCFNQSSSIRVSLKAVVITCLAQSAKFFPKLFANEFFDTKSANANPNNYNNIASNNPGNQQILLNISPNDLNFKLFNNSGGNSDGHTMAADGYMNLQSSVASTSHSTTSVNPTQYLEPKEEFLLYLNNDDPLLRGGTALLIGCLLRGFLETDSITSNQIYPSNTVLLHDSISIPTLLIYLLRSLMDSSSVTAKLACTGIGECLPILSQSQFSEWALVALRHLLCVSSSTYWLVKLEILETLSNIDYVVIDYLEQNIQQKSKIMSVNSSSSNDSIPEDSSSSNSNNNDKDTGGAVSIPIQSKVLDFLIEQLSDNDFRVRNSAGQALVNIVPRLVFTAPLERHSFKGIASKVRDTFDVTGFENSVLRKKKIFANLSHVVGLLVNQLSNPHPDDKIRGCYHALNLLCKTFSFPPDTPQRCRTLSSVLPNPMLSFVGDILPLALDRVGLTWVANDFDVHIDIIEILGYLSRGAENVLGAYCHNVLRHIVRIINIATNIIQFRPTPPLKEVRLNPSGIVNSPLLKSSGVHLGAFTHSIHYIKVYAKLLAARVNSITIFGPDRFSQLRQTCFETLAVMLKCAGKTILPFTEEIIGYLNAHFEQEPVSVIKCINELFLVTMKPTPLVSMSNMSTHKKGSGDNMAPNAQKQYEPRSVESLPTSNNPHDELFANNKSVFSSFLTLGAPCLTQHYDSFEDPCSHNINYSYTNQEINSIIRQSEDKKTLYKLFEPLIIGSIVEYQTNHSLELKKAVLLMFSKFSKFGLDLSVFDKEQHFPTYFLNELKEVECLFSNPTQLLSYSYDLLGAMFVNKRGGGYRDLISMDDLKRLFFVSANSPHPYSYTIPTIIENCHAFVRYLYDPNDKYPETEFRESFLQFLLTNLQFSATVDILILILSIVKSNNVLYTKYSQMIAHKFFSCISLSESPYFVINSITDVNKLYVLVDKLHPQSMSSARWADALLSASHSFVNSTPNSTGSKDPLQQPRKRGLYLRESLLEAYELRWVPPLLVILRTGCKLPEEARISAARQSLYLSYHDNKQNPSPSANIISSVVIKLVKNAVTTFSNYKPQDILFTHLMNHLLYYSQVFFNKSLVPPPPSPTLTQSLTGSGGISSPNTSNISPMMMGGSMGVKPPQSNTSSSTSSSSNNNNSTHLFIDSLKTITASDPSCISEIVRCLLCYGGTSTSIHAVRFLLLVGKDEEVWKSYATSSHWSNCGCQHFFTHHCIFLLYCQAIITFKLPFTLTDTFLDKIILLINESTIKKLIETIKVEHTDTFTNHLKKIFTRVSNFLDLRKKQKLLRMISYLPANKDTLELLIVNFLQTDDISLQVAGERILNLNINQLIDVYGPTESLSIILSLYQIFMSNFYKSTTNLSVQSQFLKLIKNLSSLNKGSTAQVAPVSPSGISLSLETFEDKEKDTIDSLISTQLHNITEKNGGAGSSADGQQQQQQQDSFYSITKDYFINFISSNYLIHSQQPFNHISVLSQIDKEATIQLLESPDLDGSLIPTFISSPYSLDFQEEILEQLITKMDYLLNKAGEVGSDPLKGGPPFLSDFIWEELKELTRSLSNFINKFGIYGELCESKLLKVSTWAFIESFRRWRAEIINPYDFKLVLELSRSIILKSTASILTITDDSQWCSLLLCLYKLYCLVIRPHFGYISGQRELEENFSQDPTQVSLTQSTEMIKFLVGLLTNTHFYTPMPGSHIGQLIFDSFIRSIIPLATKGFDFIYPSVTLGDENEFGGGIIPNCPIFSSIVSPEQNMRAFIKFVHFVDITDENGFDQIWRILEPIFVAPLMDAEVGTDEITEECKCLSLSGMVSMITKVCFEINGVNSQVNLLETCSIPKSFYNHIPREKDLIFLNTNAGKKLNHLLSTIYASMPQSELPLGNSGAENEPSSSLSAYHFNIERSFSWNSFGSGQISLVDLRLFKTPTFIGINFTPIIKNLLETFESFLINPMCPPMLKKEILRSVVTLSDLFNRDQVSWMFKLFTSIYKSDESDDFLIKQHLILGICKSIAILQPTTPASTISGTINEPNHPVQIFEMLSAALDHQNISLQVSALDGILYLLEGKVNKYIQGPLLQFLFKWIHSRLSTAPFPPVQLTLRVLATMFLIIEQYSREAEETSFTKRAVFTCINLGQQASTPVPIVYGVFRGLDRLLVSFSLSHSQRELISHFSLKSLPSENPIRSLLALGLMVTCIYTGDETGITSLNFTKSTSSFGTTSINSLTAFEGGLTDAPPLSYSSDINYSSTTLEGSEEVMDSNERQRFSRVNNMEKVKMLFDKIKCVSQSSYEAYVLSEVIPTVIVDLFPSVDQILSFILGEFLKQSKTSPKIMCQILSRVFSLLIENDNNNSNVDERNNQHLINYWIIICLQNFFQIQNPSHCLWALTYLFLSSSPSKSFKLLESEFSNKIQTNEKLFLIVAAEFYYNSQLSQENKKMFKDIISKSKLEPYKTLLKILL